MKGSFWSRHAWDLSVSAKAYNPDWWSSLTPESDLQLWVELKAIWEEEQTVAPIPNWAIEIVSRMLELPMCGYYAYPLNIAQIIDAISIERCPDVVMRCYTVDPGRKVLLSYYVYCLDAWSQGASLSRVIAELVWRDQLGKDWPEIAAAIYRVLGERSGIKQVAVERLMHRLRWWIKSLIWLDDKRDKFLLDVYSGDIRGDEARWGAYGNSPYGDPYFSELELPGVKALERSILAEVADGKRLLTRIHSTWLCAPKAFRYLEKLIAEIGAIGSDVTPEDTSPFLQCEDTYPDFAANREHFTDLLRRLQDWLDGHTEALLSLGELAPVKRWLVHLLWHKLLFHARYEETFARFVGEHPHGKAGNRKPRQVT